MRQAGNRLAMALTGLVLLVGYVAAGYLGFRLLASLWAERPDPVTAVVVVSLATLVVGYLSYRFGVARIRRSVDAVPLPREQAPGVYRRVDALVDRMDVGEPELLVGRMAAPNALAIGGPRGGVLVIDRGLFRLLDADEFEAIVAHELAHLESHDGLVQTLAYSATQTVVGLVLVVLVPPLLVLSGVAWGVALIGGRPEVWPDHPAVRVQEWVGSVVALVLFVLTLLLRAHSRRREYAADDRAVAVTGQPLALARALRKIDRASRPDWGLLAPLYVRGDEENPLTRLLSTHPPMDERIERLVDRAESQGGRWRRIPVEKW